MKVKVTKISEDEESFTFEIPSDVKVPDGAKYVNVRFIKFISEDGCDIE